MYYELTDHFFVKADLDRTWTFFSTAANLPLITPPWLGFTPVTPEPIRIELDAVIDYTIKWAGLPIKWRTRIIDWQPGRQFTDLQVRGPYALWHHQHTFATCDEGTECHDKVIYKLPAGPLGRVMHRLMVKKQLKEVFEYRRKVIGEHLGWVRTGQREVAFRSLV